MVELNFKANSTTEWREYTKMMRSVFWDEFEKRRQEDVQRMIQEQINEEFEMQIGAAWHQKDSPVRQDDRNGYRRRSFEVMNGYLPSFTIPRARKIKIHYSAFGLWERVQPKVLDAMLKAYLYSRGSGSAQEIIEAFGQSRFSRSFLQKLVGRFEESLREYRAKKITQFWPYIFIDGMEITFYDGLELKKRVVLIALGMDHDKNKEILGWVTVRSEHETAVRSLLLHLKEKGLKAPDLFITDDSKGIIAALRLEYPHVRRQLCAFHKIKNINDNLNDLSHRKKITRQAGDIYQLSSSRREAIERFGAFIKDWRLLEPEAVRLFKQGFEKTLTYFDFPKDDWKSIYTSNAIEQQIGKLRDWVRRFSYFRGQTNLDLALYSYVHMKSGEGLPSIYRQDQTLVLHTFN
jgi:transposase-like protein